MVNRKRIQGRLKAAMLAAVTFLGVMNINPVEIQAKDYWPDDVQIYSPSAIVMEVNTGTVLYEKNSHEKHYPASITKILTTWLALENAELDETVTFSKDAVHLNEGDTSHISRDVGEEMTLEQTLYAVMLESANECAYATAEHIGQKLGGDYKTFISLMNKTAKNLGCEDTHFNNANGLPDEQHYTTAYDMALISCAAYKNEDFRKITGTKKYQIPPTNKHKNDTTYLSNHHNILHYHDTSKYVNKYCTGGKTGFTKVAGNTLVTYAEKDGIVIAVVIMNSSSPNHYADTNTLINYAFSNFKIFNISENETSIQENTDKALGILNDNKSFVSLDTSAYIILPNTVEFSEATFSMKEKKDESAVALTYTYAGKEVGSVEIVSSGVEVDKSYFNKKEVVKDDTKVVRVKPIYIVFLILAIVLLVLAIYYIKKFYDNFYIIRHNITNSRRERARFKGVKDKPKRRRRSDRMFK